MMKLTLSLLAAGATAYQMRADCYGMWVWEQCSQSYYQNDFCNDDCGWWYSPEADDDWSDDYFVTCDDFDQWEECNGGGEFIEPDEDCYSPWYWEECSQAYWREDYCSSECGWRYSPEADDIWTDDWYVTCDEFFSWDYC